MTEYSLLDGCGTNQIYAQRAAEMGQIALALTDHGTLAGSLHHMTACREHGVMPIVGVEAYFRPNRKVQGQKEWRYVYFHLVLLAKDGRGWLNLMRIVSESHASGFYEKPCLDLDLLRRHHEGLVCGTACLGGVLCQRMLDGDSTGVTHWVRELKSIFGDDLFLEIMPSHLPDQIQLNPDIVRVADEESIALAATCDAHAPIKEWAKKDPNTTATQDVLLMIQTNQTLKKREEKRAKGEDVFEFVDPTYYLQSEEEVRENFAGWHPGLSGEVVDRSIANTLEIASWCQPFLVGRHDKLPKFERDRPDIEILRELAHDGLLAIDKFGDDEYVERLDFELEQVEMAGIDPYLLMVRDVVEWAKSDRGLPGKDGYEEPGAKEPIMVGPGRGSAGGSLISYLVGITNIDPIAWRLQFERFYNVNRRGLPDIDVDFPRDRIDEVEEYTKRKFGRNHVLDVISHQTFGPKASIRKVGTALCLPFDLINEACKQIDDDDRSPIDEIRVVNQYAEQIATDHPEAWEHMRRIQGQVQARSEHAAALIVTPPELPVKDVIPMEMIGGQKGKLITAWGERAGKGNSLISDYGYMKFDWLRIAEIDKQAYACRLIEECTGERIDLDALPIHRDPYAVDPKVMRGFADGLLTGIFQFGKSARSITRRLKPDNGFDLAAINALIRPGPRGAGVDADYVERKQGRQETTYWHESLEPFLDYTYGLLVFQEQLIEAAHHLGGLSKVDADNFRKIASKLYRDPQYARSEMSRWYEPIRDNFIANGFTEEEFGYPTGGGSDGTEPTGVWRKFLSFSDYSFNLAHAGGYAVLAYRGMWLKVHYPREFYAAFLSKGLSEIKILRLVQKDQAVREARSIASFDYIPGRVDLLLPDINESEFDYTVVEDGIRLGLGSVKHAGPVGAKHILAQRPPGGYESYEDLERRTIKLRANAKVKGSLACAGAMDRWGRRDDLTEEKADELEREYLGVSLSTKYSAASYADVIDPRIHDEAAFDALGEDELVDVAGEVVGHKEWRDSKGGLMCFVDLAYGPNEWSVTFFSHAYARYHDLIHSRRPLFIKGRKNVYNGRSGVVPLDAEQVEDEYGRPTGRWLEYVQPVEDLAKLVRGLRDTLSPPLHTTTA